MGNRAEMLEEYKRTDPEFVKMQEEASKRLDVAEAMTTRRIEMRLSRRRFARLLGISERDLYRLECGDFWLSLEETKALIEEALKGRGAPLEPKAKE
jgi:DNA-binding transcriptional regulator YiaG